MFLHGSLNLNLNAFQSRDENSTVPDLLRSYVTAISPGYAALAKGIFKGTDFRRTWKLAAE